MSGRESTATEQRDQARRVRIGVLILVGVLLAQFFRLQVLRQHQFSLRSQANRLRAVSVPAPRGAIYDRDGRIVAENVPGYAVSLLPGHVDTVRAELRRLSPYLELDSLDRSRLIEDFREQPNRPLLVSDDASFEAVSAIEERRPAFRRAVVEMRPRRNYPAGRAVAHLVGYTGEISEQELDRPQYEEYQPGRIIGKAGMERQYDARLGGEPGVRYVEVNAVGSIVSEFGAGETAVEPTPGRDLTLGLDLALQQFADSTFPEDRRGAVVALDPETGEVLLFYSHPSYDPNRFVGGISSADWQRLQSDPDRPLLNRAVGSAYPPGSTFKLTVSALAMGRDEADIGTHMPTDCDGTYRYGIRNFRCWKPAGHGDLDLFGAIQHSCNIFFYQLGLRLGLDALMQGADRLDFGRPTGIDFPYEASGSFPRSRDWYDRRYGEYGWTESVALNLSIGQGENQQTLLRQALFYSALATGERPIEPHLARGEGLEDDRVDWSLQISEAQRRDLVEAMTAVVNEPGGTAYPYRLEDWRVAGKTGTAQNAHGEPHSWFVGFAPADDPEIVVASIVEFGHPDNTTSLAVPYAMGILDEYLSGGPSEPGPGDRVATGEGDEQ